jgi:hypothetical protein
VEIDDSEDPHLQMSLPILTGSVVTAYCILKFLKLTQAHRLDIFNSGCGPEYVRCFFCQLQLKPTPAIVDGGFDFR